jgi:hypothetical protein
MITIDLNQIIEWPGKGLMTLAAAITTLRELWGNFGGPIKISFFRGPGSGPPSIIEAWPMPPNS